MRILLLLLILGAVFSTTVTAGDAPQEPTPLTPALQAERAAGYDAESTIMELERQSEQLIKDAKVQYQKNQESGRRDKEAEFSARITRIQQESRAAKRAIAQGQSADDPEKSAFEAGMADARAGKPKPTVAGDAATAGANPKDSLQRARDKGHEFGAKMTANNKAAMQLMSDTANASRQNDTSQIQSLQRQLEKIQQTKTRLSAEGVEYTNTLNQAERDAFVEGFQAAQAGK